MNWDWKVHQKLHFLNTLRTELKVVRRFGDLEESNVMNTHAHTSIQICACKICILYDSENTPTDTISNPWLKWHTPKIINSGSVSRSTDNKAQISNSEIAIKPISPIGLHSSDWSCALSIWPFQTANTSNTSNTSNNKSQRKSIQNEERARGRERKTRTFHWFRKIAPQIFEMLNRYGD